MTHNPTYSNRRSVRLRYHDYRDAGAYFITVCTQDRECLFGQIVVDGMQLNPYGQSVQTEWMRSQTLRSNVALDTFVVMPNHFHGVIVANEKDGTARRAPTTEGYARPVEGSIPTIVRAFKSAVTKGINEMRKTPGATVWQRGYYEHVVRNEDELNKIREYIANNPMQWALDRENPEQVVSCRGTARRAHINDDIQKIFGGICP